ncbi:hypothetical protein M422DRAFT_31211 [Sphaerobolus stellatus SS14]|uniref:Uncharacterized protein n=1 Tax=Sphaerobolus stellatus (strain SS14) TaxID=990650 RepID=A0A0C9VWB4_SPHS4|nr:hypothetical protein M422DRAFT_31211 [Sphaerobolus stellatus SS14]
MDLWDTTLKEIRLPTDESISTVKARALTETEVETWETIVHEIFSETLVSIVELHPMVIESVLFALSRVITRVLRLKRFICTLEHGDIERFKPVFTSLANVHGYALQEPGIVVTGYYWRQVIEIEDMVCTCNAVPCCTLINSRRYIIWLII